MEERGCAHSPTRQKQPEKEEDDQHICRILILGDGNFSFSLALSRALLLPQQPPPIPTTTPPPITTQGIKFGEQSGNPSDNDSGSPTPSPPPLQPSLSTGTSAPQRPPLPCKFKIVATSFDGPNDLVNKYSEWSSIETKLRALRGAVTVLHNVDATALDLRVLLGGEVRDESKEGRELSRVDSYANASSPLASRSSIREHNHETERDAGSATRENDKAADSAVEKSADGSPLLAKGKYSRRAPSSQYDHVIFNHPHTGTEDMRRHRSFLGHFFHALRKKNGANNGEDCENAAMSVLKPGGVVHVTLAGEQPARWGLCEQAARHGFSLVHHQPFAAELIEGYMSKRHQTGKSFQRRNLDSTTLSFVLEGKRMVPTAGLGEEVTATDSVDFADVLEQGQIASDAHNGRSDVAKGEKGKQTCRVTEGGRPFQDTFVGTVCTLPPWLWPSVDMFGNGGSWDDQEDSHTNSVGAVVDKVCDDAGEIPVVNGKPQRMHDVVVESGNSSKVQHTTQPFDLPEVCQQCGKSYKTAQALRTHTRQLHELRQTEGGFGASKAKPLPCPDCDRLFISQVALRQHESAKHGAIVDIKPDWFSATIYHDYCPPSSEEFTMSHGGDTVGVAVEVRGGATGDGGVCSGQGEQVELAKNRLETGTRADVKICREESASLDWGLSETLLSPLPVRYDCDVCGYWFASEEHVRQHLDNLRPPIANEVVSHECPSCAKGFGSRRALLQHVNFCEPRGGQNKKVA